MSFSVGIKRLYRGYRGGKLVGVMGVVVDDGSSRLLEPELKATFRSHERAMAARAESGSKAPASQRAPIAAMALSILISTALRASLRDEARGGDEIEGQCPSARHMFSHLKSPEVRE